MQLSVVIPVREEGSDVVKRISALHRILISAGISHEMIVVDDNVESRRLAPLMEEWKLLTTAGGSGSGAARKTGTEAAVGEWVAWIDADGTYSASDLVKCWEAREGCEQIIGRRFTDYGRWRLLRLTAKRLANTTASILFHQHIPDLNSGLRIFRRHSATSWLHWLPAGFSCTSSATLGAMAYQQRIRFIPIEYHPRAEGTHSKFHPLRDGIQLFSAIFRIRWLASWHGIAGMKS